MRKRIIAALALLTIPALPAEAQKSDRKSAIDPALLSLAAGYKATFTCSSFFNAGRTLEQIAGDELNRIYPDFREAMATLPQAEIDEMAGQVTVHYLDNFPPRTSYWTGNTGCRQMPPGTTDHRRLPHEGMMVPADPEPEEERKTPAEVSRSFKDRFLQTAWPLGDQLRESPAFKTSLGQKIRPTIKKAFTRKTYGEGTETSAVLVIKDGTIIGEQYRDGFDLYTPQRTWSVAKSIAATVIGAAVHQGIISLDDKIMLAQWPEGDPRREISLTNLLHMASGLDNGPAGNRTDEIYWGGGRVIDHATTERLIVTPGSRWYYANNDSLIAMRYLREAMGDDKAYSDFPFTAVLNRLGMKHTYPETDWNGDFIMSSQVYTTARDLGRLGLLYLNDGMWEGERILPEGFVNFITTPAPAQPAPRADGSERFGYGAQWWLLGGFEGLPGDTFAALGNRGQHLVIIPSQNLVIVRRGFDDNGGARFDIARFASDIATALR